MGAEDLETVESETNLNKTHIVQNRHCELDDSSDF